MSRMRLREIIGKPLTGEWGNEDLTGTGVPVLRTTNFTNDGIISFDNVVTRDISPNRLNDKWLKHGDIIIEKSGGSDRQPVGRVVYYVGENNAYTFNNFTSALRVQDQSHWNPKFVFYALFYNYAIGGTRKYENKTTGLHNLKLNLFVDKFAINWISVSEQNRIVAVIDAITHLISLRQRQAEKLDELVKARFVEMFGGAYSEVIAEDVCERIVDCPHSTPKYDESELKYPAIRTSEIQDGQIEWSSMKYVGVNEYERRVKRLIPEAGDIVYAREGTYGDCVILPESHHFCLGQRTMLFRPNYKLCNSEYLHAALKSAAVKYQADMSNAGSTVPHVNVSDAKRFHFPLPPLSLQNAFATFVHEIDREKECIQRSAALLETLKRSLMQQYFG